MASFQIPNEWLCPITLSLMRDPVIAVDGHTYERSAMEEWFVAATVANRPVRSPKTNEILASKMLVSNHGLRSVMEDYFTQNPLALHATAASVSTGFQNTPLTLTAETFTKDGELYLHGRIEATGKVERKPIVLIAIVDNSGSMDEPAEPADAAESFGYTRQDLVAHGLNTLAAILGPEDMIAIVKFSTQASVVMRPTRMNETGKAAVKAAVATIKPESQTNIFEGCRVANDIANQADMAGRHIVGLLLTDGFPNVNPPRGILQTLRGLERKNPWSLSTFGFGYKLDSILLTELATWGHGVFGFIPDCTMVGTVLINFLANMLSTSALNVSVQVGPHTVLDFPRVADSHEFILRLPFSDIESVRFQGTDYLVGESKEPPMFAVAHADYCETLKTALYLAQTGNFDGAGNPFQKFYDKYELVDGPVKQLLRDIKSPVESEGQVSLSLNPKYFASWGAHYLRCYIDAQAQRLCMNFKDPGLQIYGSDLFHQIQDLGDKAFTTIPPPLPSKSKPAPSYSVGFAAFAAPAPAPVPASAPVSMASWHNQSGGCFHGDSRIKMADGSLKKMSEVVAGEEVATPHGPVPIEAVVVCGSQLASQPMVQLENLSITPWHPIYIAEEWVYPASLAPYTSRPVKTVYNLVLPTVHIVYVEGYQCCTLGHTYTGPVIGHSFFGTERVIQSLLKIDGWNDGRPTFLNLKALRDPVSGQICDWIDAPIL